MGLLIVAIDRQNKTLVGGFLGSVSSLPPLYQTNTQPFRIIVVDPTGDETRPYEAVDCTGSDLRAALAMQATGDTGDETENLLAATYEAGWAWDSVNLWYEGSIDFNTAEIAAFIGSQAFKGAILEFNLVTSGTPETIFGHRLGAANVNISANVDAAGAISPSVLGTPPAIGNKALVHGVGGVTIVDNVVTLTGLGLGFTPSYFLVFINAPSGSGAIAPNFIIGSGSTAGFSFILTGIPENNSYTFTYIPIA